MHAKGGQVARTVHGTLEPNIVKVVTLSKGFTGLEIINRSYDGSFLWLRTDDQDPVIGGDDTYVVIGARSFDRFNRFNEITVRMISDRAIRYSIEGTQ